MKREILTTDINDLRVSLYQISVEEHYNLYKKSILIEESYNPVCWRYCYDENSKLYYPLLYSSIKKMFGETTNFYDNFKCSFGYYFYIKLIRKSKKSIYILYLTDIRGGITFRFRKVLVTTEEKTRYKDSSIIYHPIEEDFSKEEIIELENKIINSISIVSDCVQISKKEVFVRTLPCNLIIYGYYDNRFFLNDYEEPDEFEEDLEKFFDLNVKVNITE